MNIVKNFDDFLNESLNEGVQFKNVSNADWIEIGMYIADADGQESRIMADEELTKIGKEALKNAKPISLTGIIRTDAPVFIKYLVDQFKRAGIVLDDKNAIVYSPNFANEIEIPVVGGESEGIFLQTYLDYTEMASNGSEFVLTACFANDENGSMDTVMDDLDDYGQFVKAAEELKQYMQTKGLENK